LNGKVQSRSPQGGTGTKDPLITFHPDVRGRAHMLAIVERRAARPTARQLEKEFSGTGHSVPAWRTIQDYINVNRPADSSDPWISWKEAAEDAAIVLPVLAEVIRLSEGRVTQITTGMGDMIVWVHTATRGRLNKQDVFLDPLATYVLAATYLARAVNGTGTEDLDAYIGFAPWWHGPKSIQTQAWENAVANEWIKAPPDYLRLHTPNGSYYAFLALGSASQMEP
jgi:hypothetical protein